jgi:S2P endopeptidase
MINEYFKNINSIVIRLLKIWFKIGMYLCLIFSISFFVYLFVNFTKTILSFINPSDYKQADQNLMILIPGVTIPFDEVPILCCVLFLAAIIHEFGHALCATSLNVSTEEFGINIFIFIPSAFVGLSSNEIELKNVVEKIQIFCAGAWNNIMSGIIALSIFMILFPNTNSTYIVGVKPTSSLYSHIKTGDLVKSINKCPVTNQSSWTGCLQDLITQKETNFCVKKEGNLVTL